MPSLNFAFFFLAGALFSAANGSVFLLGVAGLAIRKRRRTMATAVDTISRLVSGAATIVGIAYVWEFLSAWYSGNAFEWAAYSYRLFGTYGWAYWSCVFCYILVPQLFWFRYCRRNLLVAVLIASVSVLPGPIEKMVTLLLSGGH